MRLDDAEDKAPAPAAAGVSRAGSPSRGRRAELLALAASEALVELAERCLDDDESFEILSGPLVGTLPLEVREPVVRDRFILGDVLAVTAEVELGGSRGWAMRLGDDRVAAVAAAICDAEVERRGPRQAEIEDLLRRTEDDERSAATTEWRELAPTIVQFEELV